MTPDSADNGRLPLAARLGSECDFDIVALGEVMLRLDPGDERISSTRTFRAWEGGGEYNVARGLRHCFGLRAAVVTALADNPVGRLIEDMMRQGGVDLSWLQWGPMTGSAATFAMGSISPNAVSDRAPRSGARIAQTLPPVK